MYSADNPEANVRPIGVQAHLPGSMRSRPQARFFGLQDVDR